MNSGGYTPADLQNMGFFFHAVHAFDPIPTLTESTTLTAAESSPVIEPGGSAEPDFNATQPETVVKVDGELRASAVNPNRRGKVARLPQPVRENLNTLLYTGSSYQQIITWLNAQGHVGFNKVNLHNWRIGGFQEWLRQRSTSEVEVPNAEGGRLTESSRLNGSTTETTLIPEACSVHGLGHSEPP
jgi:hypothetical protein